jgi:hypothetical protein
LSVSTADRSRLHRLFLDESANARKRVKTCRQHLHFKPICAALGPTTKVACDDTKWPEVTGAEPVAANAGRGPCRRGSGRFTGAIGRTGALRADTAGGHPHAREVAPGDTAGAGSPDPENAPSGWLLRPVHRRPWRSRGFAPDSRTPTERRALRLCCYESEARPTRDIWNRAKARPSPRRHQHQRRPRLGTARPKRAAPRRGSRKPTGTS